VEVLESPNNRVSMEEIEDIFYGMMSRYTDATERVHLADKWKDGTRTKRYRFVSQRNPNRHLFS